MVDTLTARVTSKGQITVPKQVRERLGIQPGDEIEFHFDDDRLEVRPVHRRRIAEFRGLFAVDEVLTIEEERARSRAIRAEHLTDISESPDA
jgi:AbrB family looped-hinge helix DNA binding protein